MKVYYRKSSFQITCKISNTNYKERGKKGKNGRDHQTLFFKLLNLSSAK